MNLFKNPFYLLEMTTRDSKQKILEACDLKSLQGNPEDYTRAKAALLTPKARIAAEVSWLPTLSPARTLHLIETIKSKPNDVIHHLDGLDPLSKCNLSVEYISRVNFKGYEDILEKWILNISYSYEKIDANIILKMINEDRLIAGIPSIQSLDILEDEIIHHRQYIVDVIKSILNTVSNPDVLMSKIVNHVTSAGTIQAPSIINDLVDKYQIEVQIHLNNIADNIRNIISTIYNDPKKNLTPHVNNIEKLLRTWDQIAQPIHLTMQSKGLPDEHSTRLAHELRDFTIYIANKLDMHEHSKILSTLLLDIFKDLPIFAEKLSEDAIVLDEILDEKKKNAAEEERWKKDIHLNTIIGDNKLVISHDKIAYRGISLNTDEVDRVRWGIYKRSVNLIPVERKFTIWVGDGKRELEIECVRFLELESIVLERYILIVNKLWKAVCTRLLRESLMRLSNGESISYGDITVFKNGIHIWRRVFFGEDKIVFCPWTDLQVYSADGMYILQSKSDRKVKGSLSYRDINNVHILESIISFLWKDGNYKRLERGEFI